MNNFNIKHCKCNIPAKALQAKKPGPNCGRWFLVCGDDDACKFFEWAAGPPLPPQPQPAPARSTPRIRLSLTSNPDSGSDSSTTPLISLKPLHSKDASAWLRSKNIPYAAYDPANKAWNVSLDKLEDAKDRIKRNFPNLLIEELPPFVTRLLLHRTTKDLSSTTRGRTDEECQDLLSSRLPVELVASLKPFQRSGVARAVFDMNGRCLLADEMGLGKTVQTISILAAFKDDWPVLIVCPSSLRLNWKAELKKWLDLDQDNDIQILFSGSEPLNPAARVLITSYDLASRQPARDRIAARGFRAVVCDESHYLKSIKAQRTKALLPLLKKAARALLLTGTPALARPLELFTSLSVLLPDIFYDLKSYGQRYCDAKESFHGTGLDLTGASNLEELNWILRTRCMIRRLKQDVATELPEKLRRRVYLPVTDPEMKQELAELMSESSILDRKISSLEAQKNRPGELQQAKASKLALTTKTWMLTGKAKIPAVCEYLSEFLEESEECKAIVFAHHVEVMDALYLHAKSSKWNPIRIDGSTPATSRQQLCDNFQTDPSVLIAILSLNAAGVGLTLTKADLVVFAEIAWTPALLLQAEDRAHRIGREEKVEVVYLLADGSLDGRMLEVNLDKLKVVGKVVEGGVGVVGLDVTKEGEKKKKEEVKGKQRKLNEFFEKGKLVERAVEKVVEISDSEEEEIEIEACEPISIVTNKEPETSVARPPLQPVSLQPPSPPRQQQQYQPQIRQFKFKKPSAIAAAAHQENQKPVQVQETQQTRATEAVLKRGFASPLMLSAVPLQEQRDKRKGGFVMAKEVYRQQSAGDSSDDEDDNLPEHQDREPTVGFEELDEALLGQLLESVEVGFHQDGLDESLLGQMLEAVEKVHIH